MKKIGYIMSGYPEIRCIINKGGRDCEYYRTGKIYNFLVRGVKAFPKIVRKILRRPEKTNWDIRAIYRPLFAPKADVIHTFNTVCDMRTPWVATFETIVPRTNTTCNRGLPNPNSVTMRGFELLLSDSCIGLLALSRSNRLIQIKAMEALKVPGRDKIAEKILVCPPPQDVLITGEEFEEKYRNISERVEFIFVGRLFFRKGGAQMVEAFADLVGKYPNAHLTVISSLKHGDAVSRSTAEDAEKYRQLMNSYDWITYYDEMPNSEVLKLCRKAHVGLLPTFADTYGYSVLEMQACGCPVITTDIRALPEINNEQCGWLIEVPKHPYSEGLYDTEEELESLKNAVYAGVHRVLREILEHPESIRSKGEASLNRIKENHSPEKYADFLAGIYKNASMNGSAERI